MSSHTPRTGPSRFPSLRLTPQERRSLALVAGLFLLGATVRWLRQQGWL